MKIAFSKYFNDSFELSHAAFISITVHLIFFTIQPFGFFNKPLVQKTKYKKIHLEVVNKPDVFKVPPKKLEIKKPVIHKKLALPKPVVIPVRNPIKKVKSNPVQIVMPMVSPLSKSAPKSVEIMAEKIVSSPVSTSHAGRYVIKGPRMNAFAKVSTAPTLLSGTGNSQAAMLVSSGVQKGFDRRGFQPRAFSATVGSSKRGRLSTLVSTRGGIKHSFAPQVRNVPVLIPDENKQPQLSEDELNSLWAGYTTTVRKMIAHAKVYPPAAREKGQQGKIHLFFKLGKDGDVLKLIIENSSGHSMLDKAAIDAVRDAGPFPPIPKKLNKQYVLLTLPVSFVLR